MKQSPIAIHIGWKAPYFYYAPHTIYRKVRNVFPSYQI